MLIAAHFETALDPELVQNVPRGTFEKRSAQMSGLTAWRGSDVVEYARSAEQFCLAALARRRRTNRILQILTDSAKNRFWQFFVVPERKL